VGAGHCQHTTATTHAASFAAGALMPHGHEAPHMAPRWPCLHACMTQPSHPGRRRANTPALLSVAGTNQHASAARRTLRCQVPAHACNVPACA
jgi:hypothetical protein